MEILSHFKTSVRRALSEIDPDYLKLPGVVICGTHKPKNVEALIDVVRMCRENRIPFLGLCFGHQIAAIEYARNVLGITDATSQEFGVEGTMIVKKRLSLKVGLHEGESWWSNFEVRLPVEWEKPEWFITTPSHPEYQSFKDKPHPLLVSFIELCKKQ